ncbi:MAG: hypothetical protein KA792_00265 [Bacteroidales bacterium]|nr:hypothetical protein [Bacteroidales bacterium]
METPFDTIPASVKTLKLNLQCYNADLNNSKDCNIKIKITNTRKNKITFEKSYPVTLGTDRKGVLQAISIDTAEWLKNFGDTNLIPYELECKLTSGLADNYLDGWSVAFMVKGAKFEYKYVSSYDSPQNSVFICNKYFKADYYFSIEGYKLRIDKDI